MSESAPISFFFIIVALFGTICYVLHEKDTLKKEAVERGCAEWVVDSSGNTEWKWKEVPSE